MSLISWLKSKSAAETLIAKAAGRFRGRQIRKDALGDLISRACGDSAAGTKADVVLANIQTRLANYNMIPALAPTAVVSPAASPATTPAATANK